MIEVLLKTITRVIKSKQTRHCHRPVHGMEATKLGKQIMYVHIVVAQTLLNIQCVGRSLMGEL